ncbi:hypothetical protein [Sandarakinorhabdus glacialis]|nr:hypothetical protein [Polymorphobacter glacialis]
MPNCATGVSLLDLTASAPHTARAALSGPRKLGLTITGNKIDGVARYPIGAA